jgi:serine protease Do
MAPNTCGMGWRRAFLAAAIGAIVGATGLVQSGSHGWLVRSAAAQTQAPTGRFEIADMIDKVKPAVVGVRTHVAMSPEDQQRLNDAWDELFGGKEGSPKGKPKRSDVSTNLGSGFFISSDGYIVTANHVVEDGQNVEITADDGKTYPARIVGVDPKTDLALLKVDGGQNFPFVQLATKAPRIGEWVVAVGNPFGLGGTVTAGIVSARARDIKSGMLNDFVQIDASVNQGNSGGPTFDLQGNVMGVNSAIFSPTGGSVGIGFAIPAETVTEIVAKLKERGAIVRGWLGVQIVPVTQEVAEGLGISETKGAMVVEPEPNGPAAKAGISAGDIIKNVNGEAVQDDRELVKRIASLQPGSRISLDISRRQDQRTVDVTIAKMPDERRAATPPTQRVRPVK